MTSLPIPGLDRDVPALLVKVGRFPQQHGGLGVLRSLGRAGVPMFAMVEDRFTPAAVSRYLTGRFVSPTTGREDPQDLVERLLRMGREIGRRTVAVAADDEAAVLLAEHADLLSEWFALPSVAPELPRRLASKEGLHRICGEAGVDTPRSCAPRDLGELVAVGRTWGYPLVLKNLEAYTRLCAPVVSHTTMIRSEAELLALCGASRTPSVLVQEYIPVESTEVWATHLYCASDGTQVVFTGRKLRSWPPYSGMTSRGCAVPNPRLAELAGHLCRRIGYRGIADLDWLLDQRDGRFKLVDFNPRIGAQFRLFETVLGVDVVRALHLDLTGRRIPAAAQAQGRMFAVGQVDLLSAVAGAWHERRPPTALLPRRDLERAWLSGDDPMPAAAEAVRFSGTVARRLTKPLRKRMRG
ncbi:ATP-grasp domain-containing protein [Streptomyces sp. NBC_00028]|uniref:carboxylate--amine ligase n=1 Tax=Streptomyces sp. NBC_00028 TaxID=2975624 RepID=UPI00324D4691